MFGYVVPDKPNMFIKDFTMYRAFYCGLCKTIGKKCSQSMRFFTNYDMTFFAALLHAVRGEQVEIRNEVCILNPVRKKSVVAVDRSMIDAMNLNTILGHWKVVDDIEDKGGVARRILDSVMIKRHYRKACKAMPEVAAAVEKGYRELAEREREGCASLDIAAHPFAEMMKECTRLILGDDYQEAIGEMMYCLGKWVYFADAIDDVEEDAKKGEYNCMLVGYDFKDRATFLADRKDMITFALEDSYRGVNEAFDKVELKAFEGVITNIIWYGLKEQTAELLRRTTKCKRTRI